jgi:hypothetical protein
MFVVNKLNASIFIAALQTKLRHCCCALYVLPRSSFHQLPYRPTTAIMTSPPRRCVIPDNLHAPALSTFPDNGSPFFLEILKPWCGFCKEKVDLINNINLMNAVAIATHDDDAFIPRAEWVDYENLTPAQSAMLTSIQAAPTEGVPAWFYVTSKDQKAVPVPAMVVHEANTQGIGKLREFVAQQSA